MIEKSLLWKVQRPHIGVASYVFGTMHVRDNIAYRHVDKVIAAMCQCETMMCEIDIDRAQSEIDPMVYMIPDGRLSDLMSERHFTKCRKVMLKTYDMDLLHLEQFLPLIIFNKISESLLSKDNGFPLDVFLWNKAKDLKLKTEGLETIEEHTSILKELDIKVQIKMLRSLLSNTAKFNKSMSKLTKLYEQENIQALFKVTKSSMGHFRKRLIYNRNQIMVDRISKCANTPTLYAVGAAHLAGKKGILNLLKQKNYKLSPIK